MEFLKDKIWLLVREDGDAGCIRIEMEVGGTPRWPAFKPYVDGVPLGEFSEWSGAMEAIDAHIQEEADAC